MKKKLLGTILATIMVISLAGCGKEVAKSQGDLTVGTEQDAEATTGESLEVLKPVETTKQEETSSAEVTTPEETAKQEETTKPVESNKGINQLDEEMNEKVEVFKCYTEQKQRLFTIETTVGGRAAIDTVWDDYNLYSQNTGIAKIEGKIICGVTEGTTYVVIECMSIREVYKIIVKGESSSGSININSQIGTNQLNEEMNEKVEVFKCYTEQKQRLFTIKTTVGGKAAIDTVWDDYKLYSQDTGIANINGKLIYGVSKGTTYVVIECMSLKEVYKIVVE